MKKTAILSILLCLCMVMSLLSGVNAFAATIEAGTVADIDGYVCPAADGYQNYHFTAEEAGEVTITTDGPSSVENWTSGEGYMQFFEEGGTATIAVAEGDVVRVQTQYTSKEVTLAATFTPAAGGEGGEDEVIDTSVLEGTYEAGYAFLGMPDMWVLTFNNGVLTIKDNNNNAYTGSYDYTEDADGTITISGGDGTIGVIGTPGNYTFFCGGCPSGVAMVKTANASAGGSDEPVLDSANIEGVWEAGFPMMNYWCYELTFNNGTLTIVDNNNTGFSGNYTYVAEENSVVVTSADGFNIYADLGGTWYIQLPNLANTLTMRKIAEVSDDEPVDPPAATEPITVWGPYDMNDQYTNGSIGAGQTQEYLIYQISQGTLVITGNNLTVVFNGETYTTSRWNNTISISVSEEDMTNPDEYGGSYAALSVSSAQGANYTVKFVFPEGSMDNAVELDNLLKVPTTLLSDGSYYYTWTADFTGELTLYLNQGIEGAVVDIIIHNEDYSTFANLVTYDDNDNMVAAESLTIDVEEGVTYTINIQEYTDEEGNLKGGTIIFSNREELTATGTADDPFTVTVPGTITGAAGSDTYYTYTATEDCVLDIIFVTGKPYISGVEATDIENGKRIVLTAGQTIVINPWGSAVDFELSLSLVDLSSVPGSVANPEEIDSIDGLVFNTDNSDYYYMWTATENGTLTITLNTTWSYGYNLLVNGESLYGNGETMEIEVAVGDEIVLVNTVYASASSDGSITLAAEFDNGEGSGDVPNAGDYTFLVFALMAMSMTALVVLVSKKRAF